MKIKVKNYCSDCDENNIITRLISLSREYNFTIEILKSQKSHIDKYDHFIYLTFLHVIQVYYISDEKEYLIYSTIDELITNKLIKMNDKELYKCILDKCIK